eukprot:gene15096-20313_t
MILYKSVPGLRVQYCVGKLTSYGNRIDLSIRAFGGGSRKSNGSKSKKSIGLVGDRIDQIRESTKSVYKTSNDKIYKEKPNSDYDYNKRKPPSNTFNDRTGSKYSGRKVSTDESFDSELVNPLESIVFSVVLDEGKSRLFKEGNPIIYGGAIQQTLGKPTVGQEVYVRDHNGNIFGRGMFNPYSQYRVRMLALASENIFNLQLVDLLTKRIQQAIQLRECLSIPKNNYTNVFRLINGEGDKLSGLIIDVLGKTVVIQSSAVWAEIHSEIILDILKSLFINYNEDTPYLFVWRRSETRLDQDGFGEDIPELVELKVKLKTEKENRTKTFLEIQDINDKNNGNSASNNYNLITTNSKLVGNSTEIVFETVIENGIYYKLSPESGQKTGFYCDQRENRKLIKDLSYNKSILDAYCYTGGFMLNAILGGASKVTAIDSSFDAIQLAKANLIFNQQQNRIENKDIINDNKIKSRLLQRLSSQTSKSVFNDDNDVTFIEGDAVAEMENLLKDNQYFDIVICDPPKLAPTKKSLDNAMNKYTKINTLGLSLVSPEGGLMLTCTCSSAMTQSGEFENMISKAAKLAKREVKVVSVQGAGGDHPILTTYPEGKYLTAVLLHVS